MFARVKHGLYKQRRVIVLRVNGVIALFLHSALCHWSHLQFTFYSSLFRFCGTHLAAFDRLSFAYLLLLPFYRN